MYKNVCGVGVACWVWHALIINDLPPPMRHAHGCLRLDTRFIISMHVKKLWTSMHNSAYNRDFKNLIAPLNSLGTLEIYHVIKAAN